ncbi:hypothetical protein BT63DRAFT_422244 [Microthyrium microscopicum]|uniref:Uncharacterized protein n=1 Tax=Microthyrium microscopicum TaxID=703497 RepID=A0A6A6UJ36_9PEZI|nr:hypothetical protein BT63DRAFT_422244 [Microthyrium microscopicum]
MTPVAAQPAFPAEALNAAHNTAGAVSPTPTAIHPKAVNPPLVSAQAQLARDPLDPLNLQAQVLHQVAHHPTQPVVEQKDTLALRVMSHVARNMDTVDLVAATAVMDAREPLAPAGRSLRCSVMGDWLGDGDVVFYGLEDR